MGPRVTVGRLPLQNEPTATPVRVRSVGGRTAEGRVLGRLFPHCTPQKSHPGYNLNVVTATQGSSKTPTGAPAPPHPGSPRTEGLTGRPSWCSVPVCFRTLPALQPGTQRHPEALLPPSPPRPGPPGAVRLVAQASRVLVCRCGRRHRSSEERGVLSRTSGAMISEALREEPGGWSVTRSVSGRLGSSASRRASRLGVLRASPPGGAASARLL